MADANDVAKPSDEQSKMCALADMGRKLMGGTAAMRAAGIKYLPKEPAETKEAYDNRVARSTLFNAFGKTVVDMTGRVFEKPVVLEANVPPVLKDYAENIDLTGRHINVFARDAFMDALVPGIGFILTDMPPKVTRADSKPATLADEQAAKLRPYLVYIPLERMLGWKSQTVGGVEVLTQVRILECVKEPDGDFLEKEVEQIRVIEPGVWRTFRKTAAANEQRETWVQYDTGTTSLQKIALVPFYTNRTDFMEAAPPLAKLAELNVEHWQSASDQRNILHVARVPILFGAGFADADKLVIGASTMVRTTNDKATLKFVEHTGAAIDAGDKDLQNIELRMQAMGLQLLIDKPGQTATGEMRDDSKENSPLAMMARSLGDALETSLGFMGEYIGLGEDKGGEVKVNQDYGINAGRTDLQQLVQAFIARGISRQTLWEEMQRRNFLSDSFDPEAEAARIESEAPMLDGPAMDLGSPPGPPGKGASNNGPPANSNR